MREIASRWRQLVVDATEGSDPARLVVGTGVLMVIAQLAFRAWALYPSWFYADDYQLLQQAGHGLTLSYLTEPYHSHFMPLGRLVVWLVAAAGPMSWGVAATLTLLLQAATGVAALWMLVTLFGSRWGVLAPLALYLTTAVTVPAFMWWAACLNQLPLQLVFFVSVATWTQYLRTRSGYWLALTLAALVLGLLCFEKVLLLAPVLLFLAVAYFGEGTLRDRLRWVVRDLRPAAVLGVLLPAAYLGYYLDFVPQAFGDGGGKGLPAGLADAMLGTALSSGVVGGPWSWWDTTPPIVLASPPGWGTYIAWVAITLTLCYSALRRHNVLRGWALAGGYGVALYLLLATSRGRVYGALSGLEYRYLTDAACVITLVLGLVFLELRGAPGSARPRSEPLLGVTARPALWGTALALVALGGLLSSVQYVSFWHHDNASQAYVANLRASMAAQKSPPQLVDQPVPSDVMPSYTAPDNTSRSLLRLLHRQAGFPDSSDRLQVVDRTGVLRPALVATTVRSMPGPLAGCGWKVGAAGRTIDLTGRSPAGGAWARLGYLSSHDSAITVTAGGVDTETSADRGLHNLFVRVPGAIRSVTVSGLDPGVTMCVDPIEIGKPVPAFGGLS